jgi:hypothetical protein
VGLTIQTVSSKALLKRIRSLARNGGNGRRGHWTLDEHGDLLRYARDGDPQYHASLRGTPVGPGLLKFDLLWPEDVQRDQLLYGTYHGTFVEMLLANFGEDDLDFIVCYPSD